MGTQWPLGARLASFGPYRGAMAGLDYSAGCVNFRDVGEWVEVLVGHTRYLPRGRILRGGKLDAVTSVEAIGNPATVLNVRRGPDRRPAAWDCDWVHVPLPKVASMSDYDASHPTVRRWLQRVFAVLAMPETRYPVLIHCTSGKDRTGMVVAAILALLDVPHEVIADEFALSDGGVDRAAIVAFLIGMGPVNAHFASLDVPGFQRRALRGV